MFFDDKITSKQLIWIIGIGLIIVLFGWNNVLELRAEEPRRAVVSMEMAFFNNYIIPKISGWSYYNKPPVFNWVMVLFFKLFNSFEEWVVRMPSLISLLILAFANYKIVQQWLSKKIAILSSLFFLTSADILFYGTVNSGEIDLFYSTLVYLQIMSLFVFWEKRNYLFLFLGAYFFAAVGFLTKGIPSIAFQALSLLALIVYSKEWKWLFRWQHFFGLLVFLIIVVGYFYTYAQEEDVTGFLVRQFKEASQRTGLETKFLDTAIQFFTFPFLLGKLIIPWVLFLPLLFLKKVRQVVWENKLLRFAIIFCITNLPIYWFSGDFRSRYMYMFLPCLCIIIAAIFEKNAKEYKYYTILEKLFIGITIVIPIAAVTAVFLPQTQHLPNMLMKSIFVFVVGGSIAYAYVKSEKNKVYYFILSIVCARLLFNFAYLPALQEQSQALTYRDEMKKIAAVTNNEQVFLYGKVHEFKSDASIGLLKFKEVELTTAPLIAYQIPYYLMKYTQKPLVFHEKMQRGNYYILPKAMQENEVPIFQFKDKWLQKEMVLIKAK